MNPVYYWLVLVLLGPIASVAIVQWLAVGRLGGRITVGWAGLAAYLLAGNGMRLLVGVSVWSLVVGLVAAVGVGVGLRLAAKPTKQTDANR